MVKIKTLLLYDDQGTKTATQVLRRLTKLRIDGDSQIMGADWAALRPSLGERLAGASHLVAVLSPGVPGSSWFAFASGFARGKGLPFLGFGAAEGMPAFSPCLPIPGEEELDAYFTREQAEWPPREAHRQAKLALLDMGIPFSAESFEQCIRERKTAAAALFLEAGFSPDARDTTGVPLLCLAARVGDRHITNMLLKAGASVNLQALDRGSTALIDCASGKHREIMADLLAAGAEVNLKSKDGQSALIIAVGLNDEEAAALLLKAGANPDDPDSLGASARKYASLFNKPGMVELFKTYAGS
jgi:hypothetical protein